MIMNKKSFFAGIVVGIILTFVFLFTLAWLDERYHIITKEENVKVVDTISDDSTYVNPSLFISEQEMMKGVQGNFTLEQVDSMQREWARLDSIESIKP